MRRGRQHGPEVGREGQREAGGAARVEPGGSSGAARGTESIRTDQQAGAVRLHMGPPRFPPACSALRGWTGGAWRTPRRAPQCAKKHLRRRHRRLHGGRIHTTGAGHGVCERRAGVRPGQGQMERPARVQRVGSVQDQRSDARGGGGPGPVRTHEGSVGTLYEPRSRSGPDVVHYCQRGPRSAFVGRRQGSLHKHSMFFHGEW
mmetsp:Transcript_11430/g.22683  ORF Transcript_11430/g.22683 Transcript_11430/m.22683 type:complete len:203 (-) Transcript_11430:92-700(-)